MKINHIITEFVTPQATAQDPGLEREKDVDVVFVGLAPQGENRAEDVATALEEVLPKEYPQAWHRPNYNGSNVRRVIETLRKNQIATVTTKPLSVAQKLLNTFQTYGIKCTIRNSGLEEDVAEGSIGTYVLNVMDETTGEHWSIEIQASNPEMAKERARQQGYKVLRIKEKGIVEDDAGDVEKRMIAKIQKEKQRLAKLKQTDPEAYKREIAKRKTSGRVPPVSTFEGVAEGSGNWYIRVKGKVVKDKQFNAIPFPSKETATQKALEIHNKKRIPLDMIKLTQSWMDGPEQGVAEGEGNFAGDTPFNLGGDTIKRLQVGDTVTYLGQRAKILAMSKTGNTSRITIANNMGGVTKDVLTRDLKRTGVAEGEHEFDGANGPVSVTTSPGRTVVQRKSWDDTGSGGNFANSAELNDPDFKHFKSSRKSDYDAGDYSNDREIGEGTAGLPDPNDFDSDWEYQDAMDAYGKTQDTDSDYENWAFDDTNESSEKVGNMDADAFDAALARMKKLAGAGPLKTVWDPAKRVYKNVPTAVQPAQQPRKENK